MSGKAELKALIAGGSRGIGAASARLFSENGYKVAFLYRNSDAEAEKLAQETGAVAVKCDVSSSCDVKNAVKKSYELLGMDEDDSFDTVIYNAGISKVGLFIDMSDEDWDEINSVNIKGAVNVVREVSTAMLSNRKGSIVLNSSMWGRCGASCEAAYSASKAALIGLGKSLAKEFGLSGVRVNMVAPGLIDTEMNAHLSKEEINDFAEETALGRVGKVSEVAEAMLFLASDKASFITGQVLGVDGGFVI